MRLAPSEIYFSQDSINNRFDQKCYHSQTRIGETLDDLITEKCSISNIPIIRVLRDNGKWISADNRRLWVFRKLEELGLCTEISVNQINHIPPQKRTSVNGGVSIRVRGDEGGHRWRSKIPLVHNEGRSSMRNIRPVTAPITQSYLHTQRYPMFQENFGGIQNAYMRPEMSLPVAQSSRILQPSSQHKFFNSPLHDPSRPGIQHPYNHTNNGAFRNHQTSFSPLSQASESQQNQQSKYRPTLSASSAFTSVSENQLRQRSMNQTPSSDISSFSSLSLARENQSVRSPMCTIKRPSSSSASIKPTRVRMKLDPEDVRYTKETFKVVFDDVKNVLNEPIEVFKVYGEFRVTDGHKRLFIYKCLQQNNKKQLKINAIVSEDKDLFLEKMREDKPWMSLMDVLQIDGSGTLC